MADSDARSAIASFGDASKVGSRFYIIGMPHRWCKNRHRAATTHLTRRTGVGYAVRA